MNCPQCGQAGDDSDKFCSNCGTTIEAEHPRGFEMVCLMSGVPLTNEIRKILYKTACEMGGKGRQKGIIKHPDFDGTVTTDYSYSSFNSMGGVKFTAQIDGDAVKGKVVFLITNFEYVEDGVWVPVVPLPRSHPASKAQYN